MAALVVTGAALIAYHNSFETPFLFDDQPHILRNPQIRHLWPPWEAMAHTGRPIVQLSLAANYAVSGFDPWSYHAMNVAIHVLAGLVLLGIVHRTFASIELRDRYRPAAAGLAIASALIWIVHPLQTEAVTYVIQRSESLASLFYLITLYGAIRGADSARAWRWYVVSVASCALGMGSKPVMVTAPVAILIYDRMFLARSFRELWDARRGLYFGLFATLGLMPLLFANGPQEWRTSAGLGVSGVTPALYAGTEPGVIVHYLRLCLWPHPLCLDYDWPIARTASAIVVPAVTIAALVSLTAWALWKRSRLGFLGVWFFLVLAPTSSVIPIADPAFEHRLYLPLAAVTVLGVWGGYEVTVALARRFDWPAATRSIVAVLALLSIVGLFTARTIARNFDYRSAIAIWTDTVAKHPANPRAHTNLGMAYLTDRRGDEALSQFYEAVRIDSSYGFGHLALAMALRMAGRSDEALPACRQAVRLLAQTGEAHFLLGSLLIDRGQVDEGYDHLLIAERLEPDRAATRYTIGMVLERRGKTSEAIRAYSEAVRIKPDYADAHRDLGLALARVGRLDEARRELSTALALSPEDARAKQGLDELRQDTVR